MSTPGRLSARARITRLTDGASFVEDFAANTPSLLTGVARVDGRTVAIAAAEPDAPPAWGPLLVAKMIRIQETATRLGCPIVYLIDRASPHTRNGRLVFAQRDGMGKTYFHHAQLSGKVPQVAALFGPVNSVRSFPIAMCDAAVMVEGTTLSLSPGQVAGQMVGESVSDDELGSARVHARVTGTVDAVADDDGAALAWVRRYLGYMPGGPRDWPPGAAAWAPSPAAQAIGDLVPRDKNQPFDMAPFVAALVDDGSLFELKAAFAPEISTGLARLGGLPVGVLANNSRHRGGILHPESCAKAVRFIQICDAYGLPLLFLADVPGFMVGRKAEHAGIIRAASRFFVATATARVPKISVVVRKAHTAGLYAMCGPAFEPDAFLALPDSDLSIVGAKFVDHEVRTQPSLQSLTGAARETAERKLRESYLTHTDPARLAHELIVDAIVPPAQLRADLILRLERLIGAQRRRGRRKSGGPIWPM